MALTPKGFKTISARVVSLAGSCSAGHQVGQELKLSCWDPGGLCGFFYHDIFPTLSVLQFGGGYPWAPEGEVTLECPDRHNALTIVLKVD